MAAIGKACLLTDIGQILIGKKKQVGCLVDAGKFDIFLAGLIVGFPEQFGKVGIAHAAHLCQLMYPQRFSAVLLDVFGNRVDRGITIVRCSNDGVCIHA